VTGGSRANNKSVVEIIRGGLVHAARGPGSGVTHVAGSASIPGSSRMSRSQTFATGVDCFVSYGDDVVRDLQGRQIGTGFKVNGVGVSWKGD
jgi:hypothetical protein